MNISHTQQPAAHVPATVGQRVCVCGQRGAQELPRYSFAASSSGGGGRTAEPSEDGGRGERKRRGGRRGSDGCGDGTSAGIGRKENGEN